MAHDENGTTNSGRVNWPSAIQSTVAILAIASPLASWMLTMQITVNRHDYELQSRTQFMTRTDADIKALKDAESSRSERLARLEAKIDILLGALPSSKR